MQVVDGIELSALSADIVQALPSKFKLFKFGENVTKKGTFVLDKAGAKSVMDEYQKHGVDLHVDYEHDQRAAAAWFAPEVKEDGLWATNVKWTPKGAELLRNREYRYMSPTFAIDGNKRITRLVNVALTNLPATQNAPALVAAKEEIVSLAEWSTAMMDDLPDSAFLYVEGGGKKDGEGKTVPRSLRHFPVRGPDGKVDPAHLRNALARIPQSSLPAAVKERATAEAERLLGGQHAAVKANERMSQRIVSAFRTVFGISTKKRRAICQ